MNILPKIFYLEFFIPIRDYFVTIKFKEFSFEWIMPFILSILLYFTIIPNLSLEKMLNFNGYLINALAILIGFSITTITILSTSSNKNIDKLKDKLSERNINHKVISLYQLIFITFSFVLFMEFFAIIFNLTYYSLYSASYVKSYSKFLFSINIFLMLHIIFLNLRNIANFYFIHWNNN